MQTSRTTTLTRTPRAANTGRFLAAILALTVLSVVAHAQSYSETVLYNFTGGTDGWKPLGPFIRDAAGNLYGLTQYGGFTGNSSCEEDGCGSLFRLDSKGSLTTLSFDAYNGATPTGSVTASAAGSLYSTTSSGGVYDGSYGGGTLVEVSPKGKLSLLHTFCNDCSTDGAYPGSGVTLDSKGNLYGTTFGGGSGGEGVVYKFDSAGNETLLYSFQRTSGGYGPAGPVILDSTGNIYGTASEGGNKACAGGGCGVLFEIDASGQYNVLYTFNGPSGGDGANPGGSLIRDPAGNLYGYTYQGGNNGTCQYGCGTIFRLSPGGKETVLHTFAGGADGSQPSGLIADKHGNLFGTTVGGSLGYGTVFELDHTGKFTTLYAFTGGSDGAYPGSGVILDSAGNLYGTGQFGGTDNQGVVFELSPN